MKGSLNICFYYHLQLWNFIIMKLHRTFQVNILIWKFQSSISFIRLYLYGHLRKRCNLLRKNRYLRCLSFDSIIFILFVTIRRKNKHKKNGKCHWFDKIDIGNEQNSIKDKKENIVTLKSERQTFQFISFLFFFFLTILSSFSITTSMVILINVQYIISSLSDKLIVFSAFFIAIYIFIIMHHRSSHMMFWKKEKLAKN